MVVKQKKKKKRGEGEIKRISDLEAVCVVFFLFLGGSGDIEAELSAPVLILSQHASNYWYRSIHRTDRF